MKATIKVFLVLAFVVSIAGCSTLNSMTRPSKEQAAAAQATAEISVQALAACKSVIPDNIAELSATGQAAIGRAVETCQTLVIFQTTRGN